LLDNKIEYYSSWKSYCSIYEKHNEPSITMQHKELPAKEITTKTASFRPDNVDPINISIPINDVQFKTCAQQMDRIKNNTTAHCTDQYVVLPRGTRVRPMRREGQYFMTLCEDIKIHLTKTIIVQINDTKFSIMVNQHPDNKESGSLTGAPDSVSCVDHFQSFVLPKGTSYYINDPKIDPIGLSNVLPTDDMFVAMEGSNVLLPARTMLTLKNKTTEKMNVQLILEKTTICNL